MKKSLLSLFLLLPLFILSAAPMGGRAGAGMGDGARNNVRGDDYMKNEYWRNRAYVDPAIYYGGGFVAPYDTTAPGPGEIDDTNALYEAYLQSNPPIPSPM